MRVYIAETPIGIFAVDEKGELIEKKVFPKEPEAIATHLSKVLQGIGAEEALELAEELAGRDYKVVFEEPFLAERARRRGIDAEIEKPCGILKAFRGRIEKLAVELGIAGDAAEYRLLLWKACTLAAGDAVRGASESKDLQVVQLVRAYDIATKTLNLLTIRISEWYGLHFPELEKIVHDRASFLKLVAELCSRKSMTAENLAKLGFPPSQAERIAKAAEESIGADFSDEELDSLRAFCREALALHALLERLGDNLVRLMDEAAPNLRAVAGPLLGARLIALAGGLTNLAKMPSSKIQVLGAEKALFRALRTGAKPPKHGVLFQHPHVHESKKALRGKVARLLANKIALAARADAFTGRYEADAIKEDYERRLRQIAGG